jgi:ArsR family transcriptional regulator
MNDTDAEARTRGGASYRDAAALLKALAHPVRLEIVALLTHGEVCVCHMQALLHKRQPYISQQLMALRDAGLVGDRREGAVVYYRLVAQDLGPVLAWVRSELARQGREVPSMDVPALPVAGCPCPHCAQLE